MAHPTPRRSVLVACSTFSEACFRGVVRFAREHDWNVVCDFNYTGAFPRGWRGDGIVALPGYNADLARHVQESGVPCVAVSLTDDDLPFPSVVADESLAGRLAADHLLERAYRNFGFAPFINDRLHGERLLAFEARLREDGCRCTLLPAVHRRVGAYWHDNWVEYQRALGAAISALPKPAGIFAGNDAVAAEAAEICRNLGISVPDQIAILGVGNNALVCESAAVPLSSVGQEVEEMGYVAAQRLLARMENAADISEVTRVPPKSVVTRVSTDTCAVRNTHVAAALSFIADQYPNSKLSVADISAAVSLSRRQLERSFRQEIGVTVSAQIIKRRMHEASRLLRTHARARVAEVAELVGFSDPRSFFRTFRRHFGHSPTVHRDTLSPVERASQIQSRNYRRKKAQEEARRTESLRLACP